MIAVIMVIMGHGGDDGAVVGNDGCGYGNNGENLSVFLSLLFFWGVVIVGLLFFPNSMEPHALPSS